MDEIKDAKLRGLTKVYASIIVLDNFSRRPAVFKYLHDESARFDLKFTLEAFTDQDGKVNIPNFSKRLDRFIPETLLIIFSGSKLEVEALCMMI